MKQNQILVNVIVLILGMLLCGQISVWFGKELQWDLAAYHFYNPYAFLQQRIDIDYWPASAMQVYLSPVLDLLSFFLITHCTPLQTEFYLGAIHGMNIGLLFGIANLFLKHIVPASYQIILALMLASLGIYAPTVLPGIGAFFNDNLISVLVLAFVFWFLILLQQMVTRKPFPWLQLLAASTLLGVAAGCKLTAAMYLIGALGGLLLLQLPWRTKLTWIWNLLLGFVTGMLIANGYWMLVLWQHFHNPVFPFYNGIFHSSEFAAVNWRDTRFMPNNWLQYIFFPFYFSSWKHPTTELYFSDYRFVIVYVLFILLAVRGVNKRQLAHHPMLMWLYGFFINAFFTWEFNFSNMRYLSALQMLAPLIIFLLVCQLTQHAVTRLAVLTLLFFALVMSMYPMGMERTQRFGHDYFNVKLPAIAQDPSPATVLIAYSAFANRDRPNPNHYLIPYFPTTWRFAGIGFDKYHFEISSRLQKFIYQKPGKIYLLASSQYMPYMYQAAQQLNLEPSGACSVITSDRQRLTNETILLCPLTPTPKGSSATT